MKIPQTLSALFLCFLVGLIALSLAAEKVDLTDGWEFRREGGDWRKVTVPHDWAILGPFDKENDRQVVRIVQDQETKESVKTGRTGGLPWLGRGEYRRMLAWPKGAKKARLCFHGVMSEPEVFLGGEKIGEWKLGYAPFSVELKPFEGSRELVVKCFNRPLSSRWYPGAGLYRPVELKWDEVVRPEEVQIIKGERVKRGKGERVKRGKGEKVIMRVHSPLGDRTVEIENPVLWSPETPHLYTLEPEGIRYGIRDIEYGADFFKLNGVRRKFKGVCMHHDLGPFGAAFDEWAFRRQVTLLKEMGCDSIRTSHNIPEERMLDICDEMGMMVIVEAFDAWELPKVKNGYNLFFKDWWKRDLEAMVRMARNHPCVVMWSIGNEVPDQATARGAELVKTLQDFIHSLDAEKTRLVSFGASQMPKAIESGVIAAMEIPAVTYRLPFYEAIHAVDPKKPVLGIETASTVSSRGVYKFPVDENARNRIYGDGQCSGYDTECCLWSNLPDDDWAMQDDRPWTIGEFIWTGFDYLGEPTPYYDRWPSHSSYFGAYDLAGLPKDRVWLYRSRWNEKEHTVKLCPSYWNFPDRVGKIVPVHVYTDGVSAELFLNGRSLGRRTKNPASRLDRYRLRWTDVVYEPGEIRVVAYDAKGAAIGSDILRTAGPFMKFKEEARDFGPYRFVTVSAVDANGNLCPDYEGSYEVYPPPGWSFKCIANGDATSLELFHVPHMKLFRGQLVYVLKKGERVKGGKGETVYAPEDASREERFANPPACARILPIRLALSNDLTQVDAMLATLKDEGFGGFVGSVRRDTNYLHNATSWRTFRHGVEQAHGLGMAIWLYDEKGYPSGAAGGQVLEGHPEWKARAYLVSVTNAPDGTVRVTDVKDDYIREGTHLSVSVSQFRFDYPNLLMREPIERFVELTHDAYARELGPALQYITSTFTDEPSLMTRWRKPMPYLCLPVSDELLAAYAAKFGHPLKDDIPALVTGEPVGETAAIRHRFWSMVAERVANNYTGPIADWAAKHGVFSGGHLLGEESPHVQVTIYGDFFQVLRGLTAPGCDMLTSNPSEVDVLTPLFAGSAGELNGAKRMMSEASDYHQRRYPKGDRRNVQVTARQVVGSLNRQIWGGINTFTSYYRWDAFSAEERRAINEEVGRTITLASEGRSAAEVAVLYPADALMTGFEPKQTPAVGGALTLRTSDVFVRAVRTLFTAGHPFLLADARSISEACVEAGALVNGPLRWRTVVLPNAVTLPIAAARKLAAFEAAGGRVIVLGQAPVNSEKAFPDAEIADLIAKWTRVKSVRHLAEAVARCHAPEIAVVRGPKEILRFSHRRTEKDGDVFFVANDSPESWKGAVRIAGDPATRVWNPRSGRFHEAAGEIALDLPPYAAVVLTTNEK